MAKIKFEKIPSKKPISESDIIKITKKEISGIDAADLIENGTINSKEDLLKCIEIIDVEEKREELISKIKKSNKKKESLGEKEGGFIALGYDRDCNIIWSNRRLCISRISGSSDRLKLKSLFGATWIEENFQKFDAKGNFNGTDWESLLSEIAEECSDAGVYSDEKIRGAGVWSDSESIVVNSGELVNIKDENFKRIGDFVYSKEFDFGNVLKYDAATDDEVEELYNAMSSFNFKTKSDLNFLFGFMSASFLCGALDWRPHICLTGRRGTGKSTMDNIFANILGKYALHIEGDSSEAGIRQILGFDARPVIIDEFGAEDDSKGSQINTAKVIRLMRSACSNMGTGTLRGTAGGEGTSFSVKFMAMISGTTPPAFTAADSSRIVTVELETITEKGKEEGLPILLSDRKKLKILGFKMFRRMIENYSLFEKNLESFRSVLMRTGTARAADTLGCFLAATATMLTCEILTEEKIFDIVNNINLMSHNEDQNHLDEADVVEHLLSTMLNYEIEETTRSGVKSSRKNQNIKNIIRDILNGSSATEFVLSQNGMKVERIDNQNCMLFVSSSKKHVQLNKIFETTRWKSGGWSKQLNRIDGALYGNKRIDGNQCKSVGIKIQI